MVRRWWWLVLLAPLLSAAAAYGVSSAQQSLFTATATLLVNPAVGMTASDSYNAIQSGKDLAETYEQLVDTHAVLVPVVAELGLPYDADELSKRVTATAVQNTQLLEVDVSDTDPLRAAQIAKAVSLQFVDHIAQQAIQLSNTYRAALDQQVADAERQIAGITQEIETLEESPNVGSRAVQEQIASLRTSLDRLGQFREQLGATNTTNTDGVVVNGQVIVVVEPAVPKTPYTPHVTLAVALATLGGFMIAGGAIALDKWASSTVGFAGDRSSSSSRSRRDSWEPHQQPEAT